MNIRQHEFAVYLLFLSCMSPEFCFSELFVCNQAPFQSITGKCCCTLPVNIMVQTADA